MARKRRKLPRRKDSGDGLEQVASGHVGRRDVDGEIFIVGVRFRRILLCCLISQQIRQFAFECLEECCGICIARFNPIAYPILPDRVISIETFRLFVRGLSLPTWIVLTEAVAVPRTIALPHFPKVLNQRILGGESCPVLVHEKTLERHVFDLDLVATTYFVAVLREAPLQTIRFANVHGRAMIIQDIDSLACW